MNAKQDKYATYEHKKQLDDVLNSDGKVCIYFLRMQGMKLVPNWYGPLKIIFADDPVYRIEVTTQNRTFTKEITKGKIKRAKSDVIISNFNENIFMELKNTENNRKSVGCTDQHCVKSVKIRSFFWSVFSCIWTEYMKIQTRKNSVFGHFSRGGRLPKCE